MSEIAIRKQYYGKVVSLDSGGKNTLQEILKIQPIDLKQLSQFASKNIIPSTYRPLVWKLLMGITPRYAESQDFVREQFTHIFDDLFGALKVLKLRAPQMIASSDPSASANPSPLGPRASLVLYRNGWNGHLNDTKNPEPEHFLLMWLISEARLLNNPDAQLRTQQNQRYLLIAHKISNLLEDPIEVYHILSSLWSLLRDNQPTIVKAVQYGIGLLRKQDHNLHRHLLTLGLFSSNLLEDLCQSIFCEIFPESCTERIFDKIFAGKFGILSCVICTLLSYFQNALQVAASVENVRNVLFMLRPEQAEVITKCALDQWHREDFTL